ncbi:forkhead box protein [Holotrichia oblita]|uniref:Forkhead box protein n=1 Tax=Holotrichia oblita TaxID=644536 RepID=A0ACB9TMC8_HOLOL|nr:forkhead box protein [Holotrichia oblita]
MEENNYNCGYCKDIISPKEIDTHNCFVGYNSEYYYMSYDENFAITMNLKSNTDDETQSTAESLDVDEMLISAVSVRPALYNYKLPLQERSAMSREQIPKRWKYLKDRYQKARRDIKKYCPSGSEASTVPKTAFKYYYMMNFLNETIDSPNTVTNLQIDDTNDKIALPSPLPSPNSSASVNCDKKAKKNSKESIDSLERAFLESLNKPVTTDEVDGFLIRVAASLRRLPYRGRCQVEISIMKLLTEAEEKYNCNY